MTSEDRYIAACYGIVADTPRHSWLKRIRDNYTIGPMTCCEAAKVREQEPGEWEFTTPPAKITP